MPPPLPAPDYLRADLVLLDPATGARRAVTVVVADAMIWPLAGEAGDPRFACQDLTPLVPVVGKRLAKSTIDWCNPPGD